MKHIVTDSGFECDVNEAITTDWRFTKAVAMADSKDDTVKLQGYVNIVELLLGAEGEKRLMEHVKTTEGMVPLSAVNAEVVSLMQKLKQEKQVKNS